MELWLIVIVSGMLTYATRLSFIVLLERFTLREWFQRALGLVPVAVLAAIIFPELLVRDGALALSADNLRLLAGVMAALIAWRTRNILLTIAGGMAGLWLLQAVT